MQNQIESLTQDNEVADIAEEITGTAEGAYTVLLERREAARAAAFAPLDAEAQSLRTEYGAIEEAAHSLETLLPAKARVAQAEADKLTLAEKPAEAALKLEEMREAERAPEAMRERQRAIRDRLSAIETEKRDAARRVFESWYAEAQSVVRAAERGLFCTLLDGLKASFYEYQERHGLVGTLDQPYSFLVKDHHLANLTADERSAEWNSGSRWYAGRGRR